MGVEQMGHQLGEALVEQAAAGYVDSYLQRSARVCPCPGLAQRAVEHVPGEGFDQASALGERMNASGADEAACRVLPADQGFCADQAPRWPRRVPHRVSRRQASMVVTLEPGKRVTLVS